jgi:hypothetical protein
MSGPLDRENRRQDILTLYSLLMQNPLVQGDMGKIWSTTMMVLEEFNRPDVPAIIGTMQDALLKQKQQQQAQQQQNQQVMQKTMMEHANTSQELHKKTAEDEAKRKQEQLKQQQMQEQLKQAQMQSAQQQMEMMQGPQPGE